MTAFWTSLWHELLRARRQRTLRLSALLLGALLVTGFVLEAARYQRERRTQAALQARVDGEWRNQPDRHPHRASHFGTYAFRPPGPLGFFDPGLESHSGSLTFLEPHQRNLPAFSDAAESSEVSRFGRPSVAFVLQVLVPLLLFCTTFSSVAGERETGTWQLSLSQGTSARSLLLGKAFGALAAVCVWLLPLLGAGWGAALVAGLTELSWDTLGRSALLAGAYLVYLGTCALLGVWLSSLHRRPQTALLSAVALWIGLWIILPQVAASLAADSVPAPARAELESSIARAVRSHGDSHDPNNPHFAELKAATMARHGVDSIEKLPVNYAGIVMAEGERISSEAFNAFHEGLAAAHAAQNARALELGLFTPLLALRAVSMAMAGTDSHHIARFDADVEAYRYRFIQQLNDLHTTKIHWANDKAERVSRAEWSRFDVFGAPPPGVGWALGHVVLPLAALGAWAGLALLALLFSARRSLES
jgi:ABC-2 type transport system permease protein